MARCYFPGCESHANTKEHIPPKSFFPDSKKNNLLTVKSCKAHNNEKTKDDIYALANICLNSITEEKSDAQEVFESNVKPQLMHNNEALMKKVLKNVTSQENSKFKFEVDSSRLDSFFDCLTHGIIYKKVKKKIDLDSYTVRHIYMNLEETDSNGSPSQIHAQMKKYWNDYLLNDHRISEILEFKSETPKGYSTEIYSVRFMGGDFINTLKSDTFNLSITVIHTFFNHFKVVSLLTRSANFENTPIHIGLQST